MIGFQVTNTFKATSKFLWMYCYVFSLQNFMFLPRNHSFYFNYKENHHQNKIWRSKMHKLDLRNVFSVVYKTILFTNERKIVGYYNSYFYKIKTCWNKIALIKELCTFWPHSKR